jgi:hypothetical protein
VSAEIEHGGEEMTGPHFAGRPLFRALSLKEVNDLIGSAQMDATSGYITDFAQFDNHKMSPSRPLEHLQLLSGSGSTLRLPDRYCQRGMGDTLGIVV